MSSPTLVRNSRACANRAIHSWRGRCEKGWICSERSLRLVPRAACTWSRWRPSVLRRALIRHAAFPVDRAVFSGRDERSQHHSGEVVAIDSSVGTLRAGLRELWIEHNTAVSFTSDNSGLLRIEPGTVGRLRGFKGGLSEGSLCVPAIIEISRGRSRAGRHVVPSRPNGHLPDRARHRRPEGGSDAPAPRGMDLELPLQSETGRHDEPIGSGARAGSH